MRESTEDGFDEKDYLNEITWQRELRREIMNISLNEKKKKK